MEGEAMTELDKLSIQWITHAVEALGVAMLSITESITKLVPAIIKFGDILYAAQMEHDILSSWFFSEEG